MNKLLSLFILIVSSGAWAQQIEEEAALFIDGIYIDDIRIKLNNGTLYNFQLPNKEILSRSIDPQVAESLVSQKVSTIEELNRNGVRAQYDPNSFELKLLLRPEQKTTQNINFDDESSTLRYGIRPAKFGAYLNHRYYYDHSDEQKFSANYDGAVSAGPWVIEGEGSYTQQTWKRGDIRLIRDNEKRSLRTTVGDLDYQISSFMNYTPLAGIEIAKEPSINPEELINNTGNYEFILDKKSKVTILVNGALYRSITFNAGKYNLSDLPISPGVNQIKLEIEAIDGERRSILFPFAFDFNVLPKNKHQFNYILGVPQNISTDERTYETSDLNIIVNHKYGLSESFTPGIFLQHNKANYIAGIDSAYMSIFGNFRIETALSKITDNDLTGIAVRPSYSFRDLSNSFDYERNYILQYTHTTEYFSFFNSNLTSNQYPNVYDFSIRQRLREYLTISFNFKYSAANQLGINSKYGIGFSATSNPVRSLTLSSMINSNKESSGNWDHNIGFFLSYSWDQGKRYFNSSYTQTGNIDMQLASRDDFEAVNIRSSAQNNQSSSNINLNFDHARYEANSQMSYDKQAKTINPTASFSFATVLAKNKFTISRPISSSYAIISPDEILSSSVLKTNSYQGALSSSNRFFDNMVVTDLTPYRGQVIFVDTSELPDGLSIDHDHINIYPTYKSAHLISLQTQSNISLHAKLLFKGQPLELATGTLKSESRQYNFFTNRHGELFIEDIVKDRYTMVIPNMKTKTFIIKKDNGIIELGEVNLE